MGKVSIISTAVFIALSCIHASVLAAPRVSHKALAYAACPFDKPEWVGDVLEKSVRTARSPSFPGITMYAFNMKRCGGSFNRITAHAVAVKNGKPIAAEEITDFLRATDSQHANMVKRLFVYPKNDCFAGWFQVVDVAGGGAALYMDEGKLAVYVGGCD